MNALEAAIRHLTLPVNNQFPRPWMTDLKRPEKARVFIVGYNQAAGFSISNIPGGHRAYIDALFNRNGMSCRQLYLFLRGGKGPSPARKNIDTLRKCLANFGINDVIETNVICYSTSMSKVLASPAHHGGKAAGRHIFWEILGIIRPTVLIVHGIAATKELGRVLSPPAANLRAAASNPAQSVSHKRVSMLLRGRPYTPMVLVIPSLAPPKWNCWQNWAPAHFVATCVLVRKFI
jgi:hypothetical protein